LARLARIVWIALRIWLTAVLTRLTALLILLLWLLARIVLLVALLPLILIRTIGRVGHSFLALS